MPKRKRKQKRDKRKQEGKPLSISELIELRQEQSRTGKSSKFVNLLHEQFNCSNPHCKNPRP